MVDFSARKIRLIMELRKQGILDADVLSAIERVPREAFLSEPFRAQAYDNIALPIAQGQTISQPYVVAFMSAALQLSDRHTVLEIGTGSGYQAAILARLCRRVLSIERHRSLMAEAEVVFRALGINNITTRIADGGKGWPELAPFARIIVTAAPEDLPTALLDQLAEGGIMITPVGPRRAQNLVRITKRGGELHRETLLPVRFVPLLSGVPRDR